MISHLKNILSIPDLRKKIGYTLMIIAICRLGTWVTVPLVDTVAVGELFSSYAAEGGMFSMINMFTGGGFMNMSIFALGIMPYISASIILQLLMVVWPRLEKIAKEGEIGRKKINQYTRYGTVILTAFQSIGIGYFFLAQHTNPVLILIPEHKLLFTLLTMISITTGTCFLMWLGEKITEKGIGNGISIIITLGILAQYPSSIILSYEKVRINVISPLFFMILIALFLLTTSIIVLFQSAQRKIPIQHARRVVGRRMMQGQTQYLPLKINTAGVIPVIFSSAIMSFPALLLGWISAPQGGAAPGGFSATLGNLFSMQSTFNFYDMLGMSQGGLLLSLRSLNLYILIYMLLTAFFCFFYTAITFNPIDLAENLKKSGAFIPGRRPGKPTSDYINFVLTRITLVGAIYLCAVAVLPMILVTSYEMDWTLQDLVGGTGLIIVAGVLLDTLKQVESQLMMRHYEGFKRRRGAA